jgi:transposase-like protein
MYRFTMESLDYGSRLLRNTLREGSPMLAMNLKLQGVKVSYVAVYKWINKYVALMDKYIEKLTPQVSGTWRADELWLKIKGDKKYLFAIMDDETRYWIAQEVAGSRYQHDA